MNYNFVLLWNKHESDTFDVMCYGVSCFDDFLSLLRRISTLIPPPLPPQTDYFLFIFLFFEKAIFCVLDILAIFINLIWEF